MAITTMESKPSGLDDYLVFLYADKEGYVYSPTKELLDGDKVKWEQHFFEWPLEKADLVKHIVEKAPEKEVYIGPALFSDRTVDKSAIAGSNAVWVDFDGRLPNSLGDIPDPSLKIKSSDDNFEHWYWKLDSYSTNVNEIEAINRALAYKLEADTGGWDSTQVLRPPDTFNHKRQRKVEIVEHNESMFSLSRFETIPRPPVPVNNYNSEQDLLDVGEIVARYNCLDMYRLLRTKVIPVGERSTKLMNLAHLAMEAGLTDKEAFSVVHSADQWWGKFRDRHNKDKWINELVFKARLKHPYNSSPGQVKELPILGIREVLESEETLEWVAEGLLEAMGCGLISARPKIGKTQWTLQLAIHLALGVPFLRYNITSPQKIGYFSLEMHLPGIQFFIKKMTSKMEPSMVDLLQENLKIIPLGQAMEVMSPNNDRLIRDFIESQEANGLFFDSLGRTHQKDLNKDENIRALFDWDATLRNQFKIYTWYVHHNRKANADNKKPKGLDDVFGNMYITASCSDVYTMWPADPLSKTIEFINLAHRYTEQEKPYVLQRTNILSFTEQSDIRVVTQEFSKNDTGLTVAGQIDNDRDLKPGSRSDGGMDF